MRLALRMLHPPAELVQGIVPVATRESSSMVSTA